MSRVTATKSDKEFVGWMLPEPPDWLELGAACFDDPSVDLDWFNPDQESQQRLKKTIDQQEKLAKAVCARCPAIIECGNYGEAVLDALGDRAYGIFGGVSLRDLRKLRKPKAS
jgi:hypothetical protein